MLLFISIALICAVIWFAAVYSGIGDKLYRKIRRINTVMDEEITTEERDREKNINEKK